MYPLHPRYATPHLCKQERKRQTPVRRRLSRIHAILGRVIPGGWVPLSRMNVRSLAGLSKRSVFHRWSAQCAARMLLYDEMVSCCAAGTNGCLDLRHRAFALNGQVSVELSKCPGSMARRAKNSVAPLRRSSAGWMSARIGRLSTCVGRRQPITIRKTPWWQGQ